MYCGEICNSTSRSLRVLKSIASCSAFTLIFSENKSGSANWDGVIKCTVYYSGYISGYKCSRFSVIKHVLRTFIDIPHEFHIACYSLLPNPKWSGKCGLGSRLIACMHCALQKGCYSVQIKSAKTFTEKFLPSKCTCTRYITISQFPVNELCFFCRVLQQISGIAAVPGAIFITQENI